MIQRPRDGTIIMGGGRWKVPVEQLIGNTDDNSKFEVLTKYLAESMKMYMKGWGDEKPGEGLLYDWTGEIFFYTPRDIECTIHPPM